MPAPLRPTNPILPSSVIVAEASSRRAWWPYRFVAFLMSRRTAIEGGGGLGRAGRGGDAGGRAGQEGGEAGRQAGVEPEAVGIRAEAGRPARGRGDRQARGAGFQAGLDPSRSVEDRGN